MAADKDEYGWEFFVAHNDTSNCVSLDLPALNGIAVPELKV
ncbi:hypothetical protein [Asaia prunellae]|nr:hypothetical protein [Asaia prunellae]